MNKGPVTLCTLSLVCSLVLLMQQRIRIDKKMKRDEIYEMVKAKLEELRDSEDWVLNDIKLGARVGRRISLRRLSKMVRDVNNMKPGSTTDPHLKKIKKIKKRKMQVNTLSRDTLPGFPNAPPRNQAIVDTQGQNNNGQPLPAPNGSYMSNNYNTSGPPINVQVERVPLKNRRAGLDPFEIEDENLTMQIDALKKLGGNMEELKERLNRFRQRVMMQLEDGYNRLSLLS